MKIPDTRLSPLLFGFRSAYRVYILLHRSHDLYSTPLGAPRVVLRSGRGV